MSHSYKPYQHGTFFFFFCGGDVENSSEETNYHPKTTPLFCHCWFDSGFFGFKLSWSFPTWKREKRDHLSTLWQKILQREQLNPWTTESTLPQTDTSPSLSWNRGPKHKSAKQYHKNLLHFDLSQKTSTGLGTGGIHLKVIGGRMVKLTCLVPKYAIIKIYSYNIYFVKYNI